MRRYRRASAVLLASAVTAAAALWTASAPASAALNSSDTAWLVTAHQDNLAEIAAGKSAQVNGSTKRIRRIGSDLVTDHTKLDDNLVKAAATLNVTLPAAPTAGQQDALRVTETKSGKDYDAAWVSQEKTAHQAMIRTNDKELSAGMDDTVQGLARDMAPVIVHHLNELEGDSGTGPTIVKTTKAAPAPRRVEAGTGGQAAATSSMPMWLGGAGVVLLVAAGAVAVAGRARRTMA